MSKFLTLLLTFGAISASGAPLWQSNPEAWVRQLKDSKRGAEFTPASAHLLCDDGLRWVERQSLSYQTSQEPRVRNQALILAREADVMLRSQSLQARDCYALMWRGVGWLSQLRTPDTQNWKDLIEAEFSPRWAWLFVDQQILDGLDSDDVRALMAELRYRNVHIVGLVTDWHMENDNLASILGFAAHDVEHAVERGEWGYFHKRSHIALASLFGLPDIFGIGLNGWIEEFPTVFERGISQATLDTWFALPSIEIIEELENLLWSEFRALRSTDRSLYAALANAFFEEVNEAGRRGDLSRLAADALMVVKRHHQRFEQAFPRFFTAYQTALRERMEDLAAHSHHVWEFDRDRERNRQRLESLQRLNASKLLRADSGRLLDVILNELERTPDSDGLQVDRNFARAVGLAPAGNTRTVVYAVEVTEERLRALTEMFWIEAAPLLTAKPMLRVACLENREADQLWGSAHRLFASTGWNPVEAQQLFPRFVAGISALLKQSWKIDPHDADQLNAAYARGQERLYRLQRSRAEGRIFTGIVPSSTSEQIAAQCAEMVRRLAGHLTREMD